MRPTKLTPALLQAFRTVVADEWAALAFTEEELVWQANQHLPETDRISYRTYQRYKADVLLNETIDLFETQDVRNNTQDDDQNTALVLAMHDTLKGALLAQKKALVRGVCEGLPNWRRYAWLLERKFPDFRLKSLAEALAKQPKPAPEAAEENKEQKETIKAEEAKKKRQQIAAKLAEEMAAEAERMKDPAYKWKKRGYTPFVPSSPGFYYTMYPEQLKALEEEMARDVAAGYQDPYAHLGYRPDPVERTSGCYLVMGMGTDRLPLLAHVYRTADAPNAEQREELWLAQEQQRRNIIRAEQGLPPENLPEPPEHAPSEHAAHGRNTIYGHSGMA